MGFLDAVAGNAFKVAEDGGKLFFPWGVMGRGYIISSEAEYVKLRRTVKNYWIISFATSFVAFQLPLFPRLVLLSLLILAYPVWVHAVIRQLQETGEKLTVKENIAKYAKETSWLVLCLLQVIAAIAALVGVDIFLSAPGWGTGFFCFLVLAQAAVIGCLLATKRKQAGWT